MGILMKGCDNSFPVETHKDCLGYIPYYIILLLLEGELPFVLNNIKSLIKLKVYLSLSVYLIKYNQFYWDKKIFVRLFSNFFTWHILKYQVID